MWWILAIIVVVWILGIGVVGAIWETKHGYSDQWLDRFDSAFFVILWVVTIPVCIIYMIGRLSVYLILCLWDAVKPKRRRRR